MNISSVTALDSQQQFLQLLVAQVQNQDPLEPVQQEDFIQQLAQFSTLEGIEKLNAQFSDMLELQQLTDGAQLVGRDVRFTIDSESYIGHVDEVTSIDGRLSLRIAGQSIPLSSVEAIVGSL